MSAKAASAKPQLSTFGKGDKTKQDDVRTANIVAAKAVADAVRTSLGPRGMDKMICSPTGEVVISNDGATILQQMQVQHPTAKMLVELSKAQDVEAGDGTTSVTVLAGALLGAARNLLSKGLHPMRIADVFLKCAHKASDVLRKAAIPVDLTDREALLKCATTSFNSKVVSQHSPILAPIAVDSVQQIIDAKNATNVDLKNIRVVKKLGGTVANTELVSGIVFTQGARKSAGGPTRVENAKIGLIQFQLSPPKTNMEFGVTIDDYSKMDRVLKQTQRYIAKLVLAIKRTGCNVLLIQKSILRDAVVDTSLQLLAKYKIMVVTEVERSEIEFISKTTGAMPVARIESFSKDKLGSADIVQDHGDFVTVTGVPEASQGKTVSILVRGSNKLIIDETERSIHDALCVVRSLVKERYMLAGGGSSEIEVSQKLYEWSRELTGMDPFIVKEYAEALEVIPETLAENAGLMPIEIVTELRAAHKRGEKTAGINIKQNGVTCMEKADVLQPLLVTMSAIKLATETVCMILKIDDVVPVR